MRGLQTSARMIYPRGKTGRNEPVLGGVTEIARTICELLEWTRPNGGPKNHECRQLLERLQAERVLRLPALRHLGGKGPHCPRRVDRSQQRFDQEPVECAARECEPLELALVEGKAESRLWREHVERYHYLGWDRRIGVAGHRGPA